MGCFRIYRKKKKPWNRIVKRVQGFFIWWRRGAGVHFLARRKMDGVGRNSMAAGIARRAKSEFSEIFHLLSLFRIRCSSVNERYRDTTVLHYHRRHKASNFTLYFLFGTFFHSIFRIFHFCHFNSMRITNFP